MVFDNLSFDTGEIRQEIQDVRNHYGDMMLAAITLITGPFAGLFIALDHYYLGVV